MMVLSFMISLLTSGLHLMLFLVVAPWMMVITRQAERKLQGKAFIAFSLLKRDIYLQLYQPLLSFPKRIKGENDCFALILMGIVMVSVLLVPSFTTGMVLGNSSDLLAIISMLIGLPIVSFLYIGRHSSFLCFRKIQRYSIDIFLFFPMLLLMILICRLVTDSTVMDQVVLYFYRTTYFTAIALIPLFICACSLFFIVIDIPDIVQAIEKDGFDSKEKAILLYSYDLQYLIWISLIAFLLWPQSIAIFDYTTVSLIYWLLACFFGIMAWLVKVFVACCLIAILRNFLFIANYGYKVGIATVLNFLALMIYFAGLNGI